ncbi:unnamed protein product, partial [Coregonus sp. 'balchen']
KCDFKDLSALKSLNTSSNRISHVDDGAFSDLVALQELNLANNRLNTLSDHRFQGLGNLSVLRLDHNHIKIISSSTFQNLSSLNVLNLTGNQLYLLKKLQTILPFTHLQELYIGSNGFTSFQPQDISNKSIGLRVLDLSQNPMRIFRITADVLPELHYVNLSDSGQNGSMTWDAPDRYFLSKMKSLHLSCVHLWSLDISLNEFTAPSTELFHPIPRLNKLYLSKVQLQSLDFIIGANLTQLSYLQVIKNYFTVVSETIIHSLPALAYFDLQDKTFTCDCSNAWFIQWATTENQTQVIDAFDFTCNYPVNLGGTKLLDLDTHYCSVDIGFFYFISTPSLVVYAYYLSQAYLYDTKRRNVRCLRLLQRPRRALGPEGTSARAGGKPRLEAVSASPDFQPDKPIIDNITDAVYGSRKTVCPLPGEWCSREIQVASFRLFDEQKDVLILVFLEEVPDQ